MKFSDSEKDLDILASINLPHSVYRKMENDLLSEKRQVEKELIRAELKIENPSPEKPKTVKPATVTMSQVSQMLGAFKTYMENQQFEELNRLSQFSPGRGQFIKELFSQYRNMKINISNVQFIPLQNKANAAIKLSNLVAVNGNKVEPNASSQFQISLHLDQEQQLKIYW